MPHFKIEFNVELDNEEEATELESQLYDVLTQNIDYNKITVDMAYEIDDPNS